MGSGYGYAQGYDDAMGIGGGGEYGAPPMMMYNNENSQDSLFKMPKNELDFMHEDRDDFTNSLSR